MTVQFDGVTERPSGYNLGDDYEHEHEHRHAEHEHYEMLEQSLAPTPLTLLF
jgi:hypothetical protein